MKIIKGIEAIIIANRVSHTNELQQVMQRSGMKVSAVDHRLHKLPFLYEKYSPNVVLLDVFFIKKEKEIIDEIITKYKVPLIVLSSQSVHETAQTVYAITNGASDFILCDQLNKSDYQSEVIHKIKNVVFSKSKQMKTKAKELSESYQKQQVQKNTQKLKKRKQLSFSHIVAIGTSTGGPKALQTVLTKLPKDFSAPIVIVQHMPSGFTKSLANRLHSICQINVKEAVDGEALQAGTAYIAPGDYHMAIDNTLDISIYKDVERDGHRPSVNILFESIAHLEDIKKLAVILTGMGKDGATGVAKMKRQDRNTVVIVESVETAIIHGMPRATLETGYVSEITHLENIGEAIIDYIMKRGN